MAMVRAALLALCSALGGGPIARPLPAMVAVSEPALVAVRGRVIAAVRELAPRLLVLLIVAAAIEANLTSCRARLSPRPAC
jgi:hypothetical protein